MKIELFCLAEFNHEPRLEFEYKAIIQAAEWIYNYLEKFNG